MGVTFFSVDEALRRETRDKGLYLPWEWDWDKM